jgi:Flp pilus assembly protein TadD
VTNDGQGTSRARRRAQRLWLLAEGAVGLAIFFCPLAIATVHLWAIAVACAIALLAVGLSALAALRSHEPFQLPAPAIAFGLAAAFVAFQLVPLPPSLLGLLAPRSRELLAFVLGPLGAWPSWQPISLDVSGTARELAKAITCVAVFLATAQVARSRRARTRLCAMLGLSGLAVALIGFGHTLVGAKELFGVFAYAQASPPFLTTFGNPNHLASFLSLGATALLSRVLSERDRKIATVWAFAYFATGVGVLLTLSRGGIVAFLAAQAMLAAAVTLVRSSERRGVPLEPRRLVVPAAVLTVLAVSAYLAWDALAAEWASTDSMAKVKDSKLAMWPTFWPMLRDHWLVGVGRGAFQGVYARFALEGFGAGASFTHPEMLPAQWALELGAPVALALLFACGASLFGALVSAGTDRERLACVFGLVVIALHELVDFGLELGGLAVPATVAFAVAVSRQERPRALRAAQVLSLVPLAAAAAAASIAFARPTLEEDGQRVAQAYAKRPADEIAALAGQAARRHPADYYPHLVAAQAYAVERPLKAERVIAFANRAMYLNPSEAAPHRLAALALRATGRLAQARVEYRLALERGDFGALEEITRVFKSAPELLDAVPDQEAFLAALADQLIGQGRLALAEAVAREAVARHGEKVPSLARLSRIAQARREPDEVERLGRRIDELEPGRSEGLVVRLQARLLRGDTEAGIRLVEDEGLRRFGSDVGLALTLAELKLSRADTRGAREALKRIPVGLDLGVRVRALTIEAAAAEADGLGTKAAAAMRTAVNLQPENAGLRLNYALLLERIGRLDQAIQEAISLAASAPAMKEPAGTLRARAEARKKELEELERWKRLEGPAERRE